MEKTKELYLAYDISSIFDFIPEEEQIENVLEEFPKETKENILFVLKSREGESNSDISQEIIAHFRPQKPKP